MHIINKKKEYKPLDKILINGFKKGILKILDGENKIYITLDPSIDSKVAFIVGGSLGTHSILHIINESLVDILSFEVDTKTSISDSSNTFAPLLQNLYLTMLKSCKGISGEFIEVNNKIYNYFICWLRDHTHTMKGMKYFSSDLKAGLELYADTQREDGMIYDRIAELESEGQGWRDYTFKKGNFIELVFSKKKNMGTPYSLQRIPVENDVEYLFIECLYFTWKATGDTEWMKQYLDNALKAVKYATSDKYRWSKKFQLLKRGYTIDTWDFMHDDDCKLTVGDNVCDIDKTTFGIMFGDNTGMGISLKYLSEMLQVAERYQEAEVYNDLSDQLYKRTDDLAWNGKFYRHHITEDSSFKRDVGSTKEEEQVTLSNAYSINRNIGVDKAKSIIETYKRIRIEMPEASPGEFYNCYPPFEKGFGKQNRLWQYMNGGVSTIVAGELARGAFCNGEELYAVDILNRLKKLAKDHDGYLHVCFNGNPQTESPKRTFQTVDISQQANIGHTNSKDSDWGDRNNDLKNLPIGKQEFKGVPFFISEKGAGFKNASHFDKINIPIDTKCASLYFLHTMSGTGIPATIEIIYTTGESFFVNIEGGKNIGSWFMPNSKEVLPTQCHNKKLENGWADYQLAWRGQNDTFDNIGTYIWGFNNPKPEHKIAKLVLHSIFPNNNYLISSISISDKPIWFPQSDLSYGIPDSWGAAAVVYALVEGLAGVIDRGVGFDKIELSPRWLFTDGNNADVTVKYEASRRYVAYSWQKNDDGQTLLLTTSADEIRVRLPFIKGKLGNISLNGNIIEPQIETIGNSHYACFNIYEKGVFKIKLRNFNN